MGSQNSTPLQMLSVDELVDSFVDIVSKNGNLLLNVGPKADGSIPELQLQRLLGLGEWLDSNGEAIFETRPWIEAEGRLEGEGTDLRFTQKGDVIYVILLDEPEISLHPQWLMLLVSLMRQTTVRAQVIVATQSAQLIRWVEPEELIVVDNEDGVSRFQKGDDMDLGEWLKEYTLDQLWVMGELGGRR